MSAHSLPGQFQDRDLGHRPQAIPWLMFEISKGTLGARQVEMAPDKIGELLSSFNAGAWRRRRSMSVMIRPRHRNEVLWRILRDHIGAWRAFPSRGPFLRLGQNSFAETAANAALAANQMCRCANCRGWLQ
jgi:hypothetical protein